MLSVVFSYSDTEHVYYGWLLSEHGRAVLDNLGGPKLSGCIAQNRVVPGLLLASEAQFCIVAPSVRQLRYIQSKDGFHNPGLGVSSPIIARVAIKLGENCVCIIALDEADIKKLLTESATGELDGDADFGAQTVNGLSVAQRQEARDSALASIASAQAALQQHQSALPAPQDTVSFQRADLPPAIATALESLLVFMQSRLVQAQEELKSIGQLHDASVDRKTKSLAKRQRELDSNMRDSVAYDRFNRCRELFLSESANSKAEHDRLIVAQVCLPCNFRIH